MIDKKKTRRHYEKLVQQTKLHKSKQRNRAVQARRKQEQNDGCFSFVIVVCGAISVSTYFIIQAVT